MLPRVRRVVGVELIRDGGSLAVTFESEDGGDFLIFLKLIMGDVGPDTKENIGFEAPALIDLDPAKRPQDTDRVVHSVLSGPCTPLSWDGGRNLLSQAAFEGHEFTGQQAELLERVRFVIESGGQLPPDVERIVRWFRFPRPDQGS